MKLFLAGMICGIILALGVMSIRAMPHRSADDELVYDNCLERNLGNTVVCDAMMRNFARADAMRAKAASKD